MTSYVFFVLVDVHVTVVDDHLHAGVVQFAGDRRQVLLRVLDDFAVDFDKHSLLHFRVLQHFADDAAVAAADHEHVLRIRVCVQRRMRHHFMINELVFNRRHHHAVEHEHFAPFGSVDHREILKIGFLRNQRFFNFGGDAEVLRLLLCIP